MELGKMTIEEFIKQDIDIDVHDDVLDKYYPAFTGPVDLTDAGRWRFREVIGLPVYIDDDLATVSLKDTRYWVEKQRDLEFLFDALAGYCSDADYKRWFKE